MHYSQYSEYEIHPILRAILGASIDGLLLRLSGSWSYSSYSSDALTPAAAEQALTHAVQQGTQQATDTYVWFAFPTLPAAVLHTWYTVCCEY